jgi:hypothetical protein
MTAVKREVFYTLGKQRDGDVSGNVIPVATYAREVDAISDGMTLPKGWHMRVERHSVSAVVHVEGKFEWAAGDVVVDTEGGES